MKEVTQRTYCKVVVEAALAAAAWVVWIQTTYSRCSWEEEWAEWVAWEDPVAVEAVAKVKTHLADKE